MKKPGEQLQGQTHDPVSAIIIAGGKSNRMGKDKRKLTLGGKSLLHIAIDLAREFSDDLIISANDRFPQFSECRTVPDKVRDEGPVMGIASCLPYLRYTHAIILSGDMPFVTHEMISRLLENETPGHACCFRSKDILQPFPGLMPVSLLEMIWKYLESGERSLHRLIDQLPATVITTGENLPEYSFLNINRPDDLRKARNIFQSDHDMEQES